MLVKLTERNANDKEASVERLLGDDVLANLSWTGRQLVDGTEATDKEEDGEEQERVCEDGIHAETCDDDGIVSGVVPSLFQKHSS